MIKTIQLIKSFSLILVLALAAHVQSDDTVARYYNGKTIVLSVGYSAGGGYDLYARAVARHLGQFIPGNPSVIVRNVPGAGSLVLMNQVANTLPADGLNIASVGSGIAFEPLFQNDRAQFDISEMKWLANLLETTSSAAVVRKDSGIESWQDLREKTLTVGATSTTSNSGIIPKAIAELLDLNINVITGYPGQSDVLLAMERNEVQGIGSYFMSALRIGSPHFLDEDGDYRIIYQLGLRADPAIPNVPLISEIAQTQAQRQAASILATRLAFGRPYLAPPGTPDHLVKALQDAFRELAKDEAFLAEGLDINYTSPEDLLNFYLEAYQSDPEVIQRVIRLL